MTPADIAGLAFAAFWLLVGLAALYARAVLREYRTRWPAGLIAEARRKAEAERHQIEGAHGAPPDFHPFFKPHAEDHRDHG